MKKYIIILLLSFATVFSQEVLDRIIAVVDDQIILESEVLQYAQNMALQQGMNPMQLLENEQAKSEILNGLIDHKVMLYRAKQDTNIIVENREVKRELENRLKMMVEEVGSEEKLAEVFGMSVREMKREFEEDVRENLMIEKLRQSRLMSLKVNREEVEQFYKEHKKQFSDRPEIVEIAHILLEIAPSPSAEDSAVTLINDLYNRIKSGASFEELARNYSQDASSKKGGNLGWNKRGDFVPEFEETAFALTPGEVSPPIRSRFGYHLVKLNERQGEKINVSHILIRLTPTSADEKRVESLADSLYTLLQEGADFGKLAELYSDDEESKNEAGNLGRFQLDNMIPLYAEKVAKLESDGFTKPFKSQMGYQILKLIEREKPRPITLENDWERIYEMALNQKREIVYLDYVDKLKKDIYIEIRD
ncbi:peptidylprolyl isomerase [bacterium]|nr:peptidylprolyl isomerase [bacterium]